MVGLREEVEVALRRWGPRYARFHEQVLRELLEFRHSPENSSIIYRLYSRADKQAGGSCLKSIDSIMVKLADWRRENPAAEVRDLHDIVGLTIVTYFQSEIDPILERLKSPDHFTAFRVIEDRKVDRDGYSAVHLELIGKGADGWRELKCELQLKTLLSDGWATRTHDPWYKSGEPLDDAVKGMISSIGDTIQSIERQSDQLKKLISGDRSIDTERKEAALFQLSYALTQYSADPVAHEYQKVAHNIETDREHFIHCRDSDARLKAAMEHWRGLVKAHGLSKSACRLIVYIALLRANRGLNEVALDAVDRWVANVLDPKARLDALAFKALCYWLLCDLDGAIEAAEAVVKLAEAPPEGLIIDNAFLASAIYELAYYLAERLFYAPSRTPNSYIDRNCDQEKIKALLERAPDVSDIRERMVNLESRGSILAMIAESVDELLEGRRLYTEANDWAKNSEADRAVFEGFYSYNERIYRRKLKQFT